MKALALVVVSLLVGAAQAQAPKKDNPACKQPNPVFAKFPGAFTTRCDRSTFAKLQVQQAKDPAAIEGDYNQVAKEGEYWEFSMVLR